MNICKYCGKEILESVKECPHCGASMEEISVLDDAEKQLEPITEKEEVAEPTDESKIEAESLKEAEPTSESLTEKNIQYHDISGDKESVKEKQWFKRKSFIIPTVVAVLFFALWLGNDSSAQLEDTQAELDTVKAELSSVETEYSEYKEKMEPFEEYSIEDIEQAKKAREEAEKEKQKQLEEEKKKGYNTGITYSQLARNPEKYEGKKIKFSGKVVQLIEGDGDEIQIRLAVDGDYDTILYCGYNKDIVSSRVLEDDYITIYGSSIGTITYESTMGGQITIPAAWVDKIDQ